MWSASMAPVSVARRTSTAPDGGGASTAALRFDHHDGVAHGGGVDLSSADHCSTEDVNPPRTESAVCMERASTKRCPRTPGQTGPARVAPNADLKTRRGAVRCSLRWPLHPAFCHNDL